VLARANRVTRGADYKFIVRRGARFTAPHVVIYVRRHPNASPVRFGFIVGKTVGIATRRNLVRRRLKAICREVLPTMKPGTDVVIRALPGSATTDWATLQEEISMAVDKEGTR